MNARTVRVEIRRNSDGEVRAYSDDYWDGTPYIWEHGNYACDCNRELFFLRAGGADPVVGATECSDGRFAVRITDGAEIVYQDGGWA
jgi:hypothetical protein